ncbi:MAG: 3-phosphoglycerate dehydrogenase [Clostridia bacterium]|nr:3-phosphoglycerate dehydrogenase [Clostridia bacterium]
MYEILRLNKICNNIYGIFDDKYNFSDECDNPDAIILRSYNMADYVIKDRLLAVGRAGAGVNNIPIPRMSQAGVVVFNTPGANANAVKELVLCGMLIASRDIIGGTTWVNTLSDDEDVPKVTEKGKANFGGNEIAGKTIGIIGLGAIGVLVANMALSLGMKVIGFDPYVTKDNKDRLSNEVVMAETLEDLYRNSDFISLHVPLTEGTRKMVNTEAISNMKNGVILLNMSRAELVDVAAAKEALLTRKINKYVVDFPTVDSLKTKNIIVIPHLGASTEEAEDNCASMAAIELKDYIENGNIKNSVNFPRIQKPRTYAKRYCVLFKTGFSVLEGIEAYIKGTGLAYDAASSDNGKLGYLILDINGALDTARLEQEGVLRIREI